MNATNKKQFLQELTELTKKYRIDIAGCGCCGSPILSDAETTRGIYLIDDDDKNLRWTPTCEMCGHTVSKWGCDTVYICSMCQHKTPVYK